MKNYEPTPDFVSRVMIDVRAYETSRERALDRLLISKPVRYALSACGALLAIMHIVRIGFTYLSPALCH